jgi:hypothetical protein
MIDPHSLSAHGGVRAPKKIQKIEIFLKKVGLSPLVVTLL